MRFHIYHSALMAIALITAPAAAASDDGSKSRAVQADMNEMADKLANKDMQNGIAAMVERMAGMMMQLPVGEFAAAIEDARPGSVGKDIPADATLADLAGDDAKAMPETLGQQSRVAMNMMSGFTNLFAKMMPEFEELARDMETNVENLR